MNHSQGVFKYMAIQRFGYRKAVRVAQLTGLLLLNVGWTNSLRPLDKGEKPEVLAADSAYMARVYEQHRSASLMASQSSGPMAIDLADEGQRGFVMRRLRAAGKTLQNSPHLFERLERVRERALARRAMGQTGPMVSTANTGWFCDHLVAVTKERVVTTPTTNVTYDANPVASCEGGANYVYADLSTYNANLSLTHLVSVGSNAGEEYSGGTNYNSVVVNPVVPASGTRQLFADSMMVAMNEFTGEEVVTYAGAVTGATTVPASISIRHPSLSPATPTTASYIQLCQQRGGTGCDYAVVDTFLRPYVYPVTGVVQARTVSPWTPDPSKYFELPASMLPYDQTMLYIPIDFTFNAGKNNGDFCQITSIRPETSAKLIKKVTGGTCSGVATMQAQLDTNLRALPPGSRNIVSYIGMLRLQRKLNDGTGCTMQEILNQAVEFKLSVVTQAQCGSEFHTRRDDFGLTDAGYKDLYFLNSCMAAGTLIKRADGSTDVIENIRLGDKVLANDKGLVLTVVDVAQGGEQKPLVHLRDEHGHEVKLTEAHPVIMASGKVVRAADVKLKDRVRTEKGVSTLVSVERSAHDGKVYNLALGTSEELVAAGLKNRTLFANGFLVGDNAMQQELSEPVKLSSAEAIERLPKSWRKDFNRRPVFASTVKP
ncbi:Hint domain-containing protein [Archangium violaceum]|uniref:Hint domain-containing protein n=1 Tax=Archangium violaceum TaxID=83451 RepID=UPI0036D8D397